MRSLILTLALALPLVACGGEEEAAPSGPVAEGRRVAIEVGADGYEPSRVTTQAGEPERESIAAPLVREDGMVDRIESEAGRDHANRTLASLPGEELVPHVRVKE